MVIIEDVLILVLITNQDNNELITELIDIIKGKVVRKWDFDSILRMIAKVKIRLLNGRIGLITFYLILIAR